MKLHALTIAIAVACSSGFACAAVAGETRVIMQPAQTVELLSQATGLTIPEVEMALGPSANYENPVEYDSANRRFRQALGRALYEQIMGRGELGAQQVQALTGMARERQARLAAGQ